MQSKKVFNRKTKELDYSIRLTLPEALWLSSAMSKIKHGTMDSTWLKEEESEVQKLSALLTALFV